MYVFLKLSDGSSLNFNLKWGATEVSGGLHNPAPPTIATTKIIKQLMNRERTVFLYQLAV